MITVTSNIMSDTSNELSAEQRKAAFATWLKPLQPANPTRNTMLTRVAPWRHEFAEAIAAGYTWPQLAKEIAPKPEIGVKTSGDHLRKSVLKAFKDAKEPLPPGIRISHPHKSPPKPGTKSPAPGPRA
jgi:hypothetical protein